jgi:hypothetical protein
MGSIHPSFSIIYQLLSCKRKQSNGLKKMQASYVVKKADEEGNSAP